MNQQVMKVFTNSEYTLLQSLDYGLDRSIKSKQNFVNLMIQHRTQTVYSVDNTKSSDFDLSLEKLDATSTKVLGQYAFIVAHVAVSMDFHRKRHVSNFFKK